jgi:NAD(P)H dehydrogenase (quinone)
MIGGRKMNVLIVYAHPEPNSLNGALKDHAIEVLEEAGHTVKVSDLHAMDFKAVADRNDFPVVKSSEKLNYIFEQYHALNNQTFTQDILDEHKKVSWADFIIFQYPIWWSDSPAILKGWFDRVLSYGFAYGPGSYDNGNLKGKKALVSITHGGKDLRNYGEFGRKGKLEERLFNIQHEKLYFCGMDVLHPFVFHSSADEETRAKLFETYTKILMNLENEKTIPFKPQAAFENGQLKKNIQLSK